MGLFGRHFGVFWLSKTASVVQDQCFSSRRHQIRDPHFQTRGRIPTDGKAVKRLRPHFRTARHEEPEFSSGGTPKNASSFRKLHAGWRKFHPARNSLPSPRKRLSLGHHTVSYHHSQLFRFTPLKTSGWLDILPGIDGSPPASKIVHAARGKLLSDDNSISRQE